MKKRIISCLIATVLVSSVFQLPVAISAATYDMSKEQLIAVLVESGYTEGTAEALSEEERVELAEQLIEDSSKVDIKTVVMEIDNLAEIESFLSYTDEELQSMGITQEKINSTTEEIDELLEMSDNQLNNEYGMNNTEIKMFRKAAEKGAATKAGKIEKDTKIVENVVNASGSITTTEMTYTQAVTNNSTSTAPSYKVTLSYTWNEVYALAVFDDEIVAGWGGGLNTKSISGTAKYYGWSSVGGSFNSTLVTSKTMTKTETAQAGIEFTFPQSSTISSGNASKTKSGSASFTLYQTQKQGYDTKLLSYYCHRVISVSSAGISISASGPAISIGIGGAWDTTAQKATIISY